MKRRLTDYFSKKVNSTVSVAGEASCEVNKSTVSDNTTVSDQSNEFSKKHRRLDDESNKSETFNRGEMRISHDMGPPGISTTCGGTYKSNDIGLAVGKILDDNEKLQFLTQTWVPPVKYNFPTKVEGKQTRKFRREWLDQHDWLAYSECLPGGFCKICVLFAPAEAGIGSQVLKTFVKVPLNKFKKATEEIKCHESTKYHQFAKEKALNFKESSETAGLPTKHVGHMMDKKKANIIEQNRRRLKPIVKTILFCAQNNLPLRGHRDDGKLSEDEREMALQGRYGVFKSLLSFRIDAGDEDLKSHLSTCRKNSTLISKTIQNEIIECIGKHLQSKIVESVQKAKYFSILCDETTDASRKEQLTFCVRYIDMEDRKVKEEFLGFVELKSTTSVSIKSTIDQEMSKLGLSYDYLCGQGYDGGANMAGHLHGVQALISQQQPLAIYTHCFSHSLNLCITKCCDIPEIRNAIGTVGTVSTFLSASANRMNALIDEIGKTNFTDSKKQRLKALCPTRWVERHESLITFKELIIPVVTVLETLSDSKTPEISSKAYMLSCAIKKSEFVVGLEVAVYCLGLTLRLSQRLQSPKQDLSSALVSVTDILENFRNIRREADLEFNSLYENAVQLADELGFDISTPRTCRRQQNRSNTPSENAEEYFRRTIFLPLVDHFISEIDKRFNRDFCGVLPLEGLIPANLERFTDDTIVSAAEKYQIFTDQIGSFSLLTAEIKMWRNKWRNACNPPDTVIDAIKELDYSFFPMISTLLQVLGTIPVTTATAERSFSTLKRLKSYLRSTMGEVRLNGLALANISKEREVPVDEIINLFSRSKNRRMSLENWEED